MISLPNAWVSPFTVALLLTTLVGCTTTVNMSPDTAGGPVSFSGGTLRATETVSLEEVSAAARKALRELQIPITDEREIAGKTVVTGRGAGDQKWTVELMPVSDALTHLRVRGGHASDLTTPIIILEKIRGNLSKSAD